MRSVLTSKISRSLLLPLFCCLTLVVCLVGCGAPGNSAPEGPKSSNNLESDQMKVEGVYVDKSYTGSKASEDIKRVYVFATITAKSGTLEVSSAGFDLKAERESASDSIDSMDVIQYDSDGGSDMARLASSYTCTNVITKITPGSSSKLAIPFNVPSFYLQDGATFSLSDSKGISGNIKFGYDAIKEADTKDAIAQSVDNEGYAAEMKAREDASPETAQDVSGRLDGYDYFLSVGGVSQTYHFSGDTFTVRAAGRTVSGTYVVKNGYLACTQDDTGWVTWIPWENSDKRENGIDIKIEDLHVEK